MKHTVVGDGKRENFETKLADVVPNVVASKTIGHGMQAIIERIRTASVVPKVGKFNKGCGELQLEQE